MIWYGLLEDGMLVAAMGCGYYPPSIFDFGYPTSSNYEYEVVELAIYDLQGRRLT